MILGSSSLDDIIARLDAIERVSSQDTQILRTVKKYRKEVETRRANLQEARADQARIVAEQAAQKQSIESQLAEQNQPARVRQGRDRADAGRGAATAGCARRAGPGSRAGRAQLARKRRPTARSRRTTPRWSSPTYDPNLPAPRYSQVVGIALQYLGIPYVWGGSSPSTGFDCSGFVMYVFAQVGVSLPHHAASQYGYGTPGSVRPARAGDLVFFSGLGHVGIYIGGGQFVHAPHTGDVVKISSIAEHGSYVGARRL